MAVTPAEAKAFTNDEAKFLYQFERQVDEFIRSTGFIPGQNIVRYNIPPEDRRKLSDKTMNEMIRRYETVGWTASFILGGNQNRPRRFVLVDPNG